jgi:cold shock CspA family protein
MPDPRRPDSGRVAEFDGDRGLGVLVADDGRELPFHCTAIADGSRQIDPGTRVGFVTFPGPLGRIEARGLVAL